MQENTRISGRGYPALALEGDPRGAVTLAVLKECSRSAEKLAYPGVGPIAGRWRMLNIISEKN